MEIIRKYPKAIQWTFLLIVFFGLCFAIQIPEGYEFAKAGTEFIDKDKLQSNNRNVTLEICLQSKSKTLTDDDINKDVKQINKDLENRYKISTQEA